MIYFRYNPGGKPGMYVIRPILEKHPSDLRALLLEGAVLDSAGRYSEAEEYYRRALKIATGRC